MENGEYNGIEPKGIYKGQLLDKIDRENVSQKLEAGNAAGSKPVEYTPQQPKPKLETVSDLKQQLGGKDVNLKNGYPG